MPTSSFILSKLVLASELMSFKSLCNFLVFIAVSSFINTNLSSNPNMSDSDLTNMIGSALQNIDIEANSFGVTVKGGYNMARKTRKYNKKTRKHNKATFSRKQKGGYLWGKQKTSSIRTTKK